MAMGLHRLASTAIGAVILTLAICGAKAENAGAWRLHGTLEGDARPLLCKDPETTNLIVDVAPRNSRAGRAFRRVWLPRHRLASFAASGRAGIRTARYSDTWRARRGRPSRPPLHRERRW